MIGVLQGFVVITVIVLLGYLVGRAGILNAGAETDLSRLTVSVMMPCLLMTMLVDADLRELFSSVLAVSFAAALACIVLYAIMVRLVWRRPVPEMVIGSLAAGYSNAGNIGIPVSVYVLGDAAYTAPVILMQLAVITPAALLLLDATATKPARSVGRALVGALLNPLLLATAVGVLVAATDVQIPAPIIEPFRLIGAAAVPLVLLTFGISLKDAKLMAPGSGRRDISFAVAMKLLVMPGLAWALGALVFDLTGSQLLAVVVLAGMPSAQSVLAIAQTYGRGELLARDAALVSTASSLPILLVITAILAP